MRTRFIAFFTLIVIVCAPFQTASASRAADATNDKPTLDFPNSITFQATITAPAKITSIMLEYGDQEETCGQVIAKAFPQFTPGTTVNVEWTWDMRQSGSLPPGAQIWWRWRYTDATGKETVSDQKTVTWLDNIHKWQMLTEGDVGGRAPVSNTATSAITPGGGIAGSSLAHAMIAPATAVSSSSDVTRRR